MDELLRELREMCVEIRAQLMAHTELLQALVAHAKTVETPHREETDTGELGTWLLTDEQVERVERAIMEEQRVRGKAYGGD